ncbi:hypothetical protein PG997_015287 [Apiospora hydei]|uniref:Uncharacterized protein n=1 Tax=Apiospora hydei TaxID=1337664 RepID=A0ABR1UQ62_9PEZI
MQNSDVQRPSKPEDRSGRVDSANPTASRAKFKVGAKAWYRPSKTRVYGAEIWEVREEDGEFQYQIKVKVEGETEPKLYNDGEWVPQEQLDAKE